jgi:hypothetical protein
VGRGGYGGDVLETAILITVSVLLMIVAPMLIGRDDDR